MMSSGIRGPAALGAVMFFARSRYKRNVQDIADLLLVSPEHVLGMERGDIAPSAEALRLYARLFRMDLEEMLGMAGRADRLRQRFVVSAPMRKVS